MPEDVISYGRSKWGKEDPSKIVAEIGQGARLPTECLGLSKNVEYRTQVVKAGAVDRILEFLLKTDQPFVDVKKGGDLPCPSIWLNILNNFCQDGYVQPKPLAQNVQYRIIVNIGPLFQDMENFEKRELFGSTDYWIKCLMFFCNMLYSLIKSEYQRIGEFLMKQKKLKSFLVRVLFMEIGEPKIVKEILEFSEKRDTRTPKPDILGLSQTFCAFSIKQLMMKPDKVITEEFGLTPIRPEHETDFLRGIIRLLETNESDGWYQGGFSALLSVFIIFFDRTQRLSGPFGVDSASEKLVPICRKYLMKYSPLSRDQFFYENVVTSIMAIGATLLTPMVKNKQVPIDYNVAKAIGSGLFEFFVDVCDSAETRASKPLEGLLRTAVSTLMLEETGKVMRERAPAIKARVERVKDRHPVLLKELSMIEEILRNPAVKLPPEPEACEFCQDKVTKENITKCQFCKSITYCSDGCQRLNWLLHQTTCEETRKEPSAKTTEELQEQGKVLFGKHITKLLLQAALKGLNILECVVVIDMCETTPIFKTYKIEEFAERYIQDEEAVEFSKKILERNKSNGALTVSFAGFTSDGLNAAFLTFAPSTAPRGIPMVDKSDDTLKWVVAQQAVAQSSLGQGGLQKMQSNPRIWQMTILKTMKP